jgi:hypothetical protein
MDLIRLFHFRRSYGDSESCMTQSSNWVYAKIPYPCSSSGSSSYRAKCNSTSILNITSYSSPSCGGPGTETTVPFSKNSFCSNETNVNGDDSSGAPYMAFNYRTCSEDLGPTGASPVVPTICSAMPSLRPVALPSPPPVSIAPSLSRAMPSLRPVALPSPPPVSMAPSLSRAPVSSSAGHVFVRQDSSLDEGGPVTKTEYFRLNQCAPFFGEYGMFLASVAESSVFIQLYSDICCRVSQGSPILVSNRSSNPSEFTTVDVALFNVSGPGGYAEL